MRRSLNACFIYYRNCRVYPLAYTFEKISVLVIESSHAMFDLTKSVLNEFGITEIYSAYGFEEGFETYCRLAPDIIIMDWLQEPMNGLELTRKIRADSRSPNPFTPVILMTAHSVKKRVFRARDSGITVFMKKPYTARLLYQRIEQIVERPQKFVKNDDFFGPDRRQSRSKDYPGGERRSPGSIREVSMTTEQLERHIRTRLESMQEKD